MRETLDFSTVLAMLVERIGRVRGEAGTVGDGTEKNDDWYSTGRKLESIKNWWDAKVATEGSGTVGLGAGSEETTAPRCVCCGLSQHVSLKDHKFFFDP